MYGITYKQNKWHIKVNDTVILTLTRNDNEEYRVQFSTPLGELIMNDIIKMIKEEFETDLYKRGYRQK